MAVFPVAVNDQFSGNESVPANVISTDTLVDDMTFDDILEGGAAYPAEALDDLTFDESLQDSLIFAIVEVEATEFSKSADAFKQVTETVADGATVAEDLVGSAAFAATISDGLAFTIVLFIGGEEFTCWVANADTFAHGQYDHFNFNSMCRIGSRYYGAREDGIYQLDGDSDAGEEIEWFMALPQTDNGTAFFKRVPRVYMGIRNAGAIYIRVLTDGGAQRVYLFRKRAESLAGAGETLGRGVKSRYWGYDLIGVDGADFELDQIEFFPIVLGRRVP
jgi:hypothetical protein